MTASPFNPVAGLWAFRIAEGYAARARPEMSDGAHSILLDYLAGQLDAVMPSAPVGDWPDAANVALDTWEDEARTDGPRVQAFDEAAGVVRFRAAE